MFRVKINEITTYTKLLWYELENMYIINPNKKICLKVDYEFLNKLKFQNMKKGRDWNLKRKRNIF